MKLQPKAMSIAMVSLSVLFLFHLYFSISTLMDAAASNQQAQLTQTGAMIDLLMDNAMQDAAERAEIFATQAGLKAPLRAGDRAALSALTQPGFNSLRAVHPGALLQFWSVPATLLLKLGQDSHNGDDLRTQRPMVVAANVHQQLYRGLELTPSGITLSGVAPITDQIGTAGSIEYAADFNDQIGQISALTHTQITVLALKPLWDKWQTASGAYRPEQNIEFADSVALYASDWSIVKSGVNSDMINQTQGDQTGMLTIAGKKYGYVSKPLIDFSGRPIGTLVAEYDFSAMDADYRASVLRTVVGQVIAYLFAFVAIALIFRGMVARPLHALAREISACTDGAQVSPLSISGRGDEIQDLADACEHLRARLHALEQQREPHSEGP